MPLTINLRPVAEMPVRRTRMSAIRGLLATKLAEAEKEGKAIFVSDEEQPDLFKLRNRISAQTRKLGDYSLSVDTENKGIWIRPKPNSQN